MEYKYVRFEKEANKRVGIYHIEHGYLLGYITFISSIKEWVIELQKDRYCKLNQLSEIVEFMKSLTT